MKILEDVMKPETRQYLYRVVAALLPVAVGLGWLTEEWIPAVLVASAAIFGLATAASNVAMPASGRHAATAADSKNASVTVENLPQIETLKKEAVARAAVVEESNHNSPYVN